MKSSDRDNIYIYTSNKTKLAVITSRLRKVKKF